MCRIARLFLLQRLKGRMSGEAHHFNNIEKRAVIKYFFLQGKAPKKSPAILEETLENMHHRMPPSKTEWPILNVVIFPPVLFLVLDDPKE